jgi:hypothetical protein
MRSSHAARRTRAPQHGELLNQQKQEKRPGSDDGRHRKRRTGRLAIRHSIVYIFLYPIGLHMCVYKFQGGGIKRQKWSKCELRRCEKGKKLRGKKLRAGVGWHQEKFEKKKTMTQPPKTAVSPSTR